MKAAEATGGEHIRSYLYCYYMMTEQMDKVQQLVQVLCARVSIHAFSALTLLVGQQHPSCKKTEWSGAGMVICLERGADLHMAQLMSLPLTVSCFNKIQIGFAFLVPAHPGSPGKMAVKRVCVCYHTCSAQMHLLH